ncbi:MAG: potassium transporter [Proteobacteria bacterium]|jgi:trk system potassium uptake protein|nr:potassium transporter [Pseudomonadota bacterium]
MQIQLVIKILGLLLISFSSANIPPIIISQIFDDGATQPFVYSGAISLSIGLILWYATRKVNRDLRYREGFLVVVLFWAVLGSIGALPFLLLELPTIQLADAFFESMSGLTTTGATVMPQLAELPMAILFYRQQLQWLGGMGIIVLAVAIMPMLGVGGMQLFRAETPGPIKDNKLTPRIKETAKALWYIYVGLTLVCALCYFLAGMNWFDAICHAFSTVAIGGFSPHDASLGYFQSTRIEWIAVVFMIIAAVNFSLHFVAWKSRSLQRYLHDREVRALLLILLLAGGLTFIYLANNNVYDDNSKAFQQGIFHLVSVFTTTGYTSSGFYWWPGALPVGLLLLSFLGGCAGSTAGGIKLHRILLLYKHGKREIVRLVHPRAELPVKLGGTLVPTEVMNSVWAFFSFYVLSFVLISLAIAAHDIDWVTAFSATAACLNNLGPGLGEVSLHYGDLPSSAKSILTFAMLLGRLELFTLLVLFTTTFWRN